MYVSLLVALAVSSFAPTTEVQDNGFPRKLYGKLSYPDSIVLKEAGVTVVIVEQVFDRSAHKLTKDEHQWLVDGAHPWGEDGGVPKTEIASFTVLVGEKAFVMPRKLWRDCFNLNHKDRNGPTTLTYNSLTRRGDSVTVKCLAGDGAGGYEVSWTVNLKSRSVSRSITSDC